VQTRQYRIRVSAARVLGAVMLALAALAVVPHPAAGDEVHGHDPEPTVPSDGAAPESTYRGVLPSGTWTPEQVATATDLVRRTEQAAQNYDTQAEIEAAGYGPLGVTEPGGWEHWGKRALNTDSHELDPEYPESLVFRQDPDGYKLYAMMFMFASPPYSLDNVPTEWAWLPGWHAHEGEFCTDVITGVWRSLPPCGQGATSSHPEPMVHVWIRDLPGCNHRFGGIGASGAHCGEHDHDPIPDCPPKPPFPTPCRRVDPLGTVPGTVLSQRGGVPPAEPDPVSDHTSPTAPPATPVRAVPRYTG
jgi:hypothetical protein